MFGLQFKCFTNIQRYEIGFFEQKHDNPNYQSGQRCDNTVVMPSVPHTQSLKTIGMARIVFILICGLFISLCGCTPQPGCTEEYVSTLLKRSLYEFSTNLLPRLSHEKENHFVVSPLSIWSLLACTSLGATDSTLAELQQVLKLQKVKCFNKKYLAIANKVVSSSDSDVTVERSSSIIVDDTFNIKNKFRSRVINSGLSSFESLSFNNPDLAAQTINDYVSRATHNTINEIIAAGDFASNTRMIIIDSIYFKGGWQIPFDPERTEDSQFFNDRGVLIGNVKLMVVIGQFYNRFVGLIKARVLELPYGKADENRYSMLLFLPAEGVSLYEVIENMKKVNLNSIKVLLAEFDVSEVIAQVPRFKMTSDLNNLDELLVDMGLKTMFDSSQARFQEISDEQLYVSNFIQKADIEVTEEGTEASAATRADFTARGSPDEFLFNRPFLFMIVDKKYDIPIFTGAYSKPTSY